MQATASPADGKTLERSLRNRSSFWRSILLELLALLIFVGIFNLLLPDLGNNLNDAALIVLGALFSVVPAAIWLTIFYRADRDEPEPKKLVFTVYLAGLLVAAALYQLVLVTIFDIQSWMFNFWWSQFFGEILIIGFLSMGVVYLVVRFLVFTAPEFDERMDGIIYAVAAGLGVATMSNFNYVLRHGGVDLDIGSVRMVINTLGFASFSGVLGYFIGQARFEKTPIYYVPGGLAISAILTGLYFFLLDRVGGGLAASAWRDLLLAGVVAVATTALVGWLAQRSNEETRRYSQLSASGDAWEPIPAPAAPAGEAPDEVVADEPADTVDPAPAAPAGEAPDEVVADEPADTVDAAPAAPAGEAPDEIVADEPADTVDAAPAAELTEAVAATAAPAPGAPAVAEESADSEQPPAKPKRRSKKAEA